MIRNSKGLTLIELLVAASLGIIVLALVYNFFFQGILFSKVVNDKTLLQQEANYIISSITKNHQTSDSYTISFDQNPDASYIKIKGKYNITYDNKKFIYELKQFSIQNNSSNFISNNTTINPTMNDLNLILTITAKEDRNNSYSTKTIISRLK